METVGLIGVGKIGLPIAENLIKSGYRVLGYRRSSLDEFEQIGGIAARSPADVGEQTDMVLTCLPSAEALDDVVQGNGGLVHTARPGQIVVELGSHLVPDKERQIAPLAAKGAVFLDGEVGGNPAWCARARRWSISPARPTPPGKPSRWCAASPTCAITSAPSAPPARSS
jgi:3-hydroxyisobutyrate dehydrogenase